MISKYFLRLSVVALNLLLFASCLGSSDDEIEYSPDAQIYSFSLTSRADTLNLLNATAFTIDQVNGKIYNKEPLPYLFHVDSAMLNISSSNQYFPFSRVTLKLSPDSSYTWNSSDSVAINRLLQILTTAPDGETAKLYDFQLNIYQQDPYLLTWSNRAKEYLSDSPSDQETIGFNGRFITYYKSGTNIKAASTQEQNVEEWDEVDVSTLPSTILLNSLLSTNSAVYALDEEGDVFASDETGITWSRISTDYNIAAIYGLLPSSTGKRILLAVRDTNSDMLYFALTDDFSEIQLMNSISDELPLSGFTSTSVENPDSYSTQYIVLAGGVDSNNAANKAIWLLHEKEGEITHISTIPQIPMDGSSLFYYDNRLYLMIMKEGENSFLYSENFGLSWIAAGDNQAFPSDTEDFIPRTNASVVTDDSNNIWIFGGISASSTPAQLVDAWSAKLNKFTMD